MQEVMVPDTGHDMRPATAALEAVEGARVVYSGPRAPHLSGQRAVVRFPNGLGLSVIHGDGTYGVEAAVIRFDGDDYRFEEGRVHGWLNAARLAELATATAAR